ncbi:MAG: phenylalanine--tRNA ligase subunit beta [Nitrososphaeraceae archaeon]|nr:phenylalanine--tRNA ligase subunit beta [Nitrososphaeraceae archaeon]
MAERCSKIPVVNLKKTKIKSSFPNYSLSKILDNIPFLGLDIEGIEDDIVRIEYNPNRPDYSTDLGIFRSLKGFLNRELGIPKFDYSISSHYKIEVDKSVKKIRPYILFFVAKNKEINQDLMEQIISMQEDLHNGIGRGRRKASIGIHDLNKMKFPLRYSTSDKEREFIPLDESNRYSLNQILDILPKGKKYSHLIKDFKKYPILVDQNNDIVSFPPIINSERTKVTLETQNLLVEVTATDLEIARNIISILFCYFYDEKFKIISGPVSEYRTKTFFPLKKLTNKFVRVKEDYINSILGLNLSTHEIISSLKKVRIDAIKLKNKELKCIIPQYRTDIRNPIDVVEEVSLGYGIYNLEPNLPSFKISAGIEDPVSEFFRELRKTIIGFGFQEVLNFSLVDQKGIEIEETYNEKNNHLLKVHESKSSEHEFLRASLIPSLMKNLSHNIHEEYPQKIFEIGKIFRIDENMTEKWNLALSISSNNTDFTQIRSLLRSIFKITFDKEIQTKPLKHILFINGRSANVFFQDHNIGIIGEVSPKIISDYNIRVPISILEIDLSEIIKDIK